MSSITADTPVRGSFRGLSDLSLVGRQVYFEQLTFWLNPIGAALTIGFSVVFIVIFESHVGPLDDRLPGPHQADPVLRGRLRRPTASWRPASTSSPSSW